MYYWLFIAGGYLSISFGAGISTRYSRQPSWEESNPALFRALQLWSLPLAFSAQPSLLQLDTLVPVKNPPESSRGLNLYDCNAGTVHRNICSELSHLGDSISEIEIKILLCPGEGVRCAEGIHPSVSYSTSQVRRSSAADSGALMRQSDEFV